MLGRTRWAPARRPLVAVAAPAEVLAAGGVDVLSATERARSASLRDPADRAAYLAAHLLVRRCAATLTGRPVAELAVRQWCADCRTAGHGRPSLADLPDVHISWAHSRGAVVAAAALHPVGVDVEALPSAAARLPSAAAVSPSAAARLVSAAGGFPGLAPAERGQLRSAADPPLLALRHWARKECLVKTGAATLVGADRIDLSRLTERRDRAGRTVSRYRGQYLVDWREPERGVLVAVAGGGVPLVRSLHDLARVLPEESTHW